MPFTLSTLFYIVGATYSALSAHAHAIDGLSPTAILSSPNKLCNVNVLGAGMCCTYINVRNFCHASFKLYKRLR